mgnify:CR=1 FL=1
MGIKVHVDLTKLDQKLNTTQLRQARLNMANDAHQAMDKYIPMLHPDTSENLRSMSFVNSDGTSIIYTAVYAKAQFYGFITNQYGGPFRIHNYTTPGTSRRWDLRLKGNLSEMAMVKEAFINGAQWHE